MAAKTKPKSKTARKPSRPAKKTASASRKSKPAAKAKSEKAIKRPVKAAPKPKAMSVGQQIVALEERLLKGKKELAELRKKLKPVEIPDYVFRKHDGSEIKLSEMFGSSKELILVHNMGKGCPYCTLWADGFVGFTKHLENRAAFVVISKDPFDIQRDFYNSRAWNFKMYSSHGTTFNRDVNFETETGGQMPGVSAFFKDENGRIYRAAFTYFGPGDDFCALWHMLDLLKDGQAGWQPKYFY
jgi:predicted dithiol-disulfide oxidoreductase (DUF899 family)